MNPNSLPPLRTVKVTYPASEKPSFSASLDSLAPSGYFPNLLAESENIGLYFQKHYFFLTFSARGFAILYHLCQAEYKLAMLYVLSGSCSFLPIYGKFFSMAADSYLLYSTINSMRRNYFVMQQLSLDKYKSTTIGGRDPKNTKDAYKILNIELDQQNNKDSILKKYEFVIQSLDEKINDQTIPQPIKEELKNILDNIKIAYETINNNLKTTGINPIAKEETLIKQAINYINYLYNEYFTNAKASKENTWFKGISDYGSGILSYFTSSAQFKRKDTTLLAGHDPRNIEDAYKILNIELEERNEKESITKKYDLVVISLNEKINDPRVPQPTREELKNALNNFNIAYQTICDYLLTKK